MNHTFFERKETILLANNISTKRIVEGILPTVFSKFIRGLKSKQFFLSLLQVSSENQREDFITILQFTRDMLKYKKASRKN